VRRWGLYGILLSTVISMACVGIPWMLSNLFSLFFDAGQLRKFIKLLFSFMAAICASGAIVSAICALIELPPLPKLLLSALTAVTVPNLLYYLCFKNKKQFQESLIFSDRVTKGKFRLLRLLGENGMQQK